MPDRKITQLDDSALPLAGDELVEIVRAGENVKTTLQNIIALFGGGQRLAAAMGIFNGFDGEPLSSVVNCTMTRLDVGSYQIDFPPGTFGGLPVILVIGSKGVPSYANAIICTANPVSPDQGLIQTYNPNVADLTDTDSITVFAIAVAF